MERRISYRVIHYHHHCHHCMVTLLVAHHPPYAIPLQLVSLTIPQSVHDTRVNLHSVKEREREPTWKQKKNLQQKTTEEEEKKKVVNDSEREDSISLRERKDRAVADVFCLFASSSPTRRCIPCTSLTTIKSGATLGAGNYHKLSNSEEIQLSLFHPLAILLIGVNT